MVKGSTRRVIVVKSPDPRYFEEAIFIVKEDAKLESVDQTQVLEEARAVARGYVKQQTYSGKVRAKIPPLGYLAAGAVLSGIVMTLL